MAITNKMIKTLINKLKEYKNSANIIQKIQELNLTADIIDNQLPLPSTMVNYANKNIKHLRQNPTIAEAMVLLDKYYDTIISSTQIELVTEHANFFVIDFLYCMNLIEAELKQHGMKLDQNLLPQFDKCQTSTTFTINYFKAILVYNYAITLYEPLFSHQATRKPKLPFKSKVPPTAITNYLQSKKILWKEPLLTLIKLIESKQYQQFIPTDMIQDAKVIAINCGAACVNKMLHRNTSKQTEKIIKDLHLTIKVLNPLLKLYANTTAKLVKEYKKKPYTNINANK